jgi:ADP-ribose pyrophosphatase YjhB (NUDIX family)
MKEKIVDAIVSIILGAIGSLLAISLQNDLLRPIGYSLIGFAGLIIFINLYYHYPVILGIKWRYATTVIVFDGDKVLLVWHPFHKVWLPPGHRVGFQEYPHEAALKSVLRETGYVVDFVNTIHYEEKSIDRKTWQIPQPYFVMKEDQGHRGGIRSHYDFYYICHVIRKEPQLKGVLDYKWYEISELERLVSEGKLYQDIRYIVDKAYKDVLSRMHK